MIDLLGVTIHDPDVVFTDLGLAILGAYLCLRFTRGEWKAIDTSQARPAELLEPSNEAPASTTVEAAA